MKYAIVIPDGCADEPQASLGGKTPLQAAQQPNMDRIAQTGVVGRSNNVPAADAGQRRGHAEPVRLRSARRLHRPCPAGNRGDGHPRSGRTTGPSAATSSRRKRGDARLHRRAHQQRRRPGADREPAADAGRPGAAFGTAGARWNFMPASAIATSSSIAAPRPAPFTAETKTQPPHDIPDRPIAGLSAARARRGPAATS